jgi:hypothetical protein
MPEPGGPATQSGILFQNQAAALWLGRLLDPRPRPPRETVISVRVEALDVVDDIVVTFADGHREYIQVKESLEPRGDAWEKLWATFARQRADPDFAAGSRLVLLLGHEPAWARALQELCLRANGLEAAEWALEKQPRLLSTVLESLRKALPAESRDDAVVFAILHSAAVRILDPERIREDHVPTWMPPASDKPFELFGRLVAKVGEKARIRRRFIADDLRRELAGEDCHICEAGEAPLNGPDVYFSPRFPHTSPDLFGRKRELALLDAAWNAGKPRVLSLVAFGGVGKTALVNKWLSSMAKDGYRGARRVYGHSFYSHGAAEGKQASADPFIAHALGWFGDPDPAAGSPWDKGERLARLIRRQRVLLVLDGVDSLQNPPPADPGCIWDPALATLLRELAADNPGLCVVTSRLPLMDLESWRGGTVHEKELENLSEVAGAAHLAHLGVKGAEPELRKASRAVGGHALALTLLGSYLVTVYGGDVRKRGRIPPLFEEPDKGRHARRVLAAYERWFAGKPEGKILLLLGLFDRPADGGALAALRAAPAIPGLTDELVCLSEEEWAFAVGHLREARLLAVANAADPGALDAHPLLREYFGERLREMRLAGWREAHRRLYEYYCAQAPYQPDTLEAMLPLFAAVAHGCAAGRHRDALYEVYWPRIKRWDEVYSTNKLGAIGADLAALASFFDPPWRKVVDVLPDEAKSWILNEAGFDLRALGWLAEAADPIRAALELDVAAEDWRNAAIVVGNLSELLLTAGDVAGAIVTAVQGIDLADQSNDAFLRLARRVNLADARHAAGRAVEAAELFTEAERMQRARQPKYPLLSSLWGYRYCDLLLARGKWPQVLRRAGQTLAWAEERGFLLPIALDHLSLGRAGLAAAMVGEGDLARAAAEMDAAIAGLRQAGVQDYLARGLLARAALRRVHQQLHRARTDLEEALAIVTRGGMRLHEADCWLEMARMALAERDGVTARKDLAAARRIVEESGYKRRKPEVAALERELPQP